jgi:hypothetical protein
MAGGTAARIERCDAIGEIWSAGSKRSLRNDRRLRQPPEDAGAGSAGQDQEKENSSQHSTVHHQASQFNDQYERTLRHKLPRNFRTLPAFRE